MSSASTSPNQIFLFHGSDTYRSHQETMLWRARYRQKYEGSAEYSIAVDDLSSDELARQLEPLCLGATLFPTPALLVLSRPSAHAEKIRAILKSIPETTFVLLWEPTLLDTDNTLITLAHQAKCFTIPADAALVARLESGLEKEGITLTPEARGCALSMMRLELERQRSDARLRSGQILKSDERGWLVASLLARLSVLPGGSIDRDQFEHVTSADPLPSRIFALVDLIVAGDTSGVRAILASWKQQSVDSGIYFSVLALLQRARMRNSPRQVSALLAQVDLIIKNGLLDVDTCILAFTDALQSGKTEIMHDSLLWKVAVARFGR
jgi:hypothetical protein